MNDRRFDALERFAPLVRPPTTSFESFLRRRDRKQRNQRIVAGIVGILVFVVPVAVVAGLNFSDRTPAPAVTGPTGPQPGATTDEALADSINTCERLLVTPQQVESALGFLAEDPAPSTSTLSGCTYGAPTDPEHVVISAYPTNAHPLPRTRSVKGLGVPARFTPFGNRDGHAPGAEGATSILEVRSGRLTLRFNAGHWNVAAGFGFGYGVGPLRELAENALATLDVIDDPAAQGSRDEGSEEVDATITVTRSECTAQGTGDPIDAESPTLMFVNNLDLHAYFVVVDLSDGTKLADLPDGRSGFSSSTPVDFRKPSTRGSVVTKGAVTPYHRTVTWSSPRSVDAGQWAVVCWLDLAIAPNGTSPKLVDVVGPLEVGQLDRTGSAAGQEAQEETPEPRAEARVIFDGSKCTLDSVDGPTHANTLRLKVVNISGESDALFRVGRIRGNHTWPTANADRYFQEYSADFVSAKQRKFVVLDHAEGRWGVICYEDGAPSQNAWAPKEADTVGPFEIA